MTYPRPRITVPEPAIRPLHYSMHPSGIECITIAQSFNFNLGNVIKYIWRAPYKGHLVEDLEKAKWYLETEIAREKRNRDVAPPQPS